MKYHIDTIPVWDAMKLDGECLLCALARRTELNEAERYLGASVMEPDTRSQGNAQGFCRKHHAMLYGMNNRLGHALMLESHHAESAKKTEKAVERFRKAAQAAAGSPLGKLTRAGQQAAKGMAEAAEELRQLAAGCIMCRSIDAEMERYLHTFFHLWSHDTEFRKAFENGKGVCLPHLADLAAMAPTELSGQALAEFAQCLENLQQRSGARIQEDISWFIKKFDYRYTAEPWKNSQDAVPRTVNKLRGWCVGDEPNPKA